MLLRGDRHGLATYTPEFGKAERRPTLQCVHCGAHWEAPEGNTRGFCQTCNGPKCNGPWCAGIGGCPGHFEKQIEAYERRMGHVATRGY